VIPIHRLPVAMRARLKLPLGVLLKGSYSQTIKEFEKMVKTRKPAVIVSVGDAVSKALLERGILPKVLIVDSVVMRKPIVPFEAESYETVNLRNEPATISPEAWTVVESAVKQHSKVKVVVEGEEDLLALVAILSVPDNALVVYGQPGEGMVVVEVTQEKKAEIRRIVDAMEYVALEKLK
jgi:uncharacterized protein (UPF0218 family)